MSGTEELTQKMLKYLEEVGRSEYNNLSNTIVKYRKYPRNETLVLSYQNTKRRCRRVPKLYRHTTPEIKILARKIERTEAQLGNLLQKE